VLRDLDVGVWRMFGSRSGWGVILVIALASVSTM